MGLWKYVTNATDQQLNSDVWGVRFDFLENRNQAVNTWGIQDIMYLMMLLDSKL